MEFKDKTVLITGGTGSLGTALCKNLIENQNPLQIIVFSRDENKQYEMRKHFPDIKFVLGDIRDYERVYNSTKFVDIIIHTAALKHVPQAEYNPYEYVKTNIIGSHNIINAAKCNGVSKLVNISTDKAVQPSNQYGATKLCAEKLFSSEESNDSNLKVFSVRFGNLIGSRGSIIPEFIKQIKENNSVEITDEKMTRFWYSLEEASSFILDRLKDDYSCLGEIYIPFMKSMSLLNVIKSISSSCKITSKGLRPGENLHEKLSSFQESRRTFMRDNYFVIAPEFLNLDRWENLFNSKPIGEMTILSSDNKELKHFTFEEMKDLIFKHIK
jgi:UDP-N-acetylglucosamine 4,6-dehydratase